MCDYSNMTDDELISLKTEFLQKAASIDKVLQREEVKKETTLAMQRLKKLMEDNKSHAYMCISKKRVHTGPSNQYYINIPENVHHEEVQNLSNNSVDTRCLVVNKHEDKDKSKTKKNSLSTSTDSIFTK